MEKSTVDPLNSTHLLGLNKYFEEFIKLYDSSMLPNVLLLTGKKGSGKFTLILHLLNYIFNKANYDLKNKKIIKKTIFNERIKNNSFPNIIYLNNFNKKIKIDDIRSLKNTLNKSSLDPRPRFIILDDVESFNHNSLNGLLKIIEEPNKNNFFILINNKQSPILETVRSRCMETILFLKEKERISIIKSLINISSIETLLDYTKSDISPGDYLRYNSLCIKNDINPKNSYIVKLSNSLRLYKKTKELDFIKISIFFTEEYFNKLILTKNINKFDITTVKIKIIKLIHKFVNYNLNINSVLSNISNNFNYG